MRNALNNLQSTWAGAGEINAVNVFKVVDQPHPLVIKKIIECCSKNDLHEAVKLLQGIWRAGYAAIDIIGTFFHVCKNAVEI